MAGASNEELIDSAQAVLNPRLVGDRLFGDVAATLVTDKGNRYSGVSIDTGSGTGSAPSTAPSPPWSPPARAQLLSSAALRRQRFAKDRRRGD
ncbi:MAG TPA: hypothetical protein VF468_05360 [Actinomycetota bacterium]|nr:hypothetical protein [Actinomycetota bacterium]